MTITEVWDHALDVEVDEDDVSGMVVHPPTCFCVHHWDPEHSGGLLAYAPHYSLEHPSCIIEYEDINVGLFDRSYSDDSWSSLEVESQELIDAATRCATEGVLMPIYVYVEYGWSPSTPVSGAEYNWYFSWRPQTLEEIEIHRH